MQVRRHLWRIANVLILGALLAACTGGSGSSGFDAISEDAAITQALDTQQCVQFEALQICPTDESLEARTPTPEVPQTPAASGTPHPPHKPQIDTGHGDASCVPALGGSQCSFMLPFAPGGFPANADFRVAARRLPPPSLWSIFPAPASTGTDAAPSFDATVPVQVPGSAPATTVAVQVAILAFISHPAAAPGDVKELSDSGADFAFVTQLTIPVAAGVP